MLFRQSQAAQILRARARRASASLRYTPRHAASVHADKRYDITLRRQMPPLPILLQAGTAALRYASLLTLDARNDYDAPRCYDVERASVLLQAEARSADARSARNALRAVRYDYASTARVMADDH